MVLLSISVPKFNQWFGPILLRYSVRARFILSRGIIRDNPCLDAFCGIPVALKLIQLEVYHECKAIETNINALTTSSSSSPTAATATDSSSLSQKLQIKHRNEEITKRRIQVFENYIRPALLPNNTWSDIRIWQFHYRILKWLRTEYLIVKYRPTIRQIIFPSDASSLSVSLTIRKSPQLTKDFFGIQQQRQQGNENPWTKLMSSIGSFFGMTRNNKHHQPMDDHTTTTTTATTTSSSPSSSQLLVLPHTATLTKVFDMIDWEMQQKNLKASRYYMEHIIQNKIGGDIIEIRGGSIGIAHVPDRDPTKVNVTELSLEEVIEVTGGHVMQCNAFNALCEDANIYQFWTREYIELLGRYLLQRSSLLLQQQPPHPQSDDNVNETIILDVGAGDGLLAQLLREFMIIEYNNIRTTTQITQRKFKSSIGPSKKRTLRDKLTIQQNTATSNNESETNGRYSIPTIIASDSGAWGISPIAPVLKQTVEEALAPYLSATNTTPSQYHVIVLCSWMPMNTDWTSIFRQNQGVEEYILIGECDDGQCGDNWLTWGNPQHVYDDTTIVTNDTSDTVIPTPPYMRDGYVRYDMNDLAPYQFSRFDCRTSKTGRTVSFRKQK